MRVHIKYYCSIHLREIYRIDFTTILTSNMRLDPKLLNPLMLLAIISIRMQEHYG